MCYHSIWCWLYFCYPLAWPSTSLWQGKIIMVLSNNAITNAYNIKFTLFATVLLFSIIFAPQLTRRRCRRAWSRRWPAITDDAPEATIVDSLIFIVRDDLRFVFFLCGLHGWWAVLCQRNSISSVSIVKLWVNFTMYRAQSFLFLLDEVIADQYTCFLSWKTIHTKCFWNSCCQVLHFWCLELL